MGFGVKCGGQGCTVALVGLDVLFVYVVYLCFQSVSEIRDGSGINYVDGLKD